MTLWHKHLEERFSTFPLYQKILMVCNELNRANHHLDDRNEYKNCMERSLELLDFLIDGSVRHNRLKEILRARGVVGWYYLHTPRDTRLLQRQLIQLEPRAWRLLEVDYK